MSVGVVIVNYNGWPDTIECLESLFRSEGVRFSVVVCDNDSRDGSLDKIRMWAEGKLDALVAPDHPLRSLSFPPIRKPIEYVECTPEELERDRVDPKAPLVLVRSGTNLGFTGGNNVAFRYFLSRAEYRYVWLLNPDTVVAPDAMAHLVAEMERDPGIGLCGSTVRYYSAPDRVQALGGASYNRWLALPRGIGTGTTADAPIDVESVLERMSYVYGASMLVSRPFLENVGLLNEELFLYLDELDWVLRARSRYRLGYAPESIVYHREGGQLGAGTAKTRVSDYYFMRNRIRVTREFSPIALPTVYLALLVAAARRASRGQWDRARMIMKLLWTESSSSS